VRGGYKALFAKDAEAGLCLGGGLYLPIPGGLKLSLDYAFLDLGILNDIHTFSLGIQF